MKKALALILALVMCIGVFAACGESKEPVKENTDVTAPGKTEDPGTTEDPGKTEDPGTTEDPATAKETFIVVANDK